MHFEFCDTKRSWQTSERKFRSQVKVQCPVNTTRGFCLYQRIQRYVDDSVFTRRLQNAHFDAKPSTWAVILWADLNTLFQIKIKHCSEKNPDGSVEVCLSMSVCSLYRGYGSTYAIHNYMYHFCWDMQKAVGSDVSAVEHPQNDSYHDRLNAKIRLPWDAGKVNILLSDSLRLMRITARNKHTVLCFFSGTLASPRFGGFIANRKVLRWMNLSA